MEYPDTPNPALAHTVNGLIKFCLQIKDALIACVEMVGLAGSEEHLIHFDAACGQDGLLPFHLPVV
jgi:hypothetical protein